MSDPKALHVARLQKAIKKAAEFRSQSLSSWTPAFRAWREKTIQRLPGLALKQATERSSSRLASMRNDCTKSSLEPLGELTFVT